MPVMRNPESTKKRSTPAQPERVAPRSARSTAPPSPSMWAKWKASTSRTATPRNPSRAGTWAPGAGPPWDWESGMRVANPSRHPGSTPTPTERRPIRFPDSPGLGSTSVEAETADRAGATRGPWGAWLAFGVAYIALAAGADWLTNQVSEYSTFWPAAGLYLGVLLITERRRWPGFVVTAAVGGLVVSWIVGRRPLLAGANGIADLVEAILAALLIRAV